MWPQATESGCARLTRGRALWRGTFANQKAIMDAARLRDLADAFYDRVWAERAKLQPSKDVEREFWTRQYLDFGRAVRAATREANAGVLDQIYDLASRHYEHLTPHDRMLGIGRVLRGIAEMAKRKD